MSHQSASVYVVGFYENLNVAKNVLNNLIPNYKPDYKNAVCGSGRIGWINELKMNELINNPTMLTCNQPHSSVNLFEN